MCVICDLSPLLARYWMPKGCRFGAMNHGTAGSLQLARVLLLGATGHMGLTAHPAWSRSAHVLIFLANIPFDIIFFLLPFFFGIGFFFNGLVPPKYSCVSVSCPSSLTGRSGSS